MTTTTEQAEQLALSLEIADQPATAEIIRSLAAERDMWRGENVKKTTACEQMGARIQAFEVENARLREALDMAKTMLQTGMPEYDANDALDVIRAALAKGEGDE
jgi:hypothetical protein